MGTRKQTVNEVQLKARRTSLGKKSVDELITIILRKDKSERKMNSKIQELTSLLNEANSDNEAKTMFVDDCQKHIKELEDIIKVKQELIDKFISEKNKFEDEAKEWSKKYVNCKTISSFRRKVIFTCFGVIAILIVLLILF